LAADRAILTLLIGGAVRREQFTLLAAIELHDNDQLWIFLI
jgi:hypothetical protein